MTEKTKEEVDTEKAAADAAAKKKDKPAEEYTNVQLAQAIRFLGGEMKKLQDANGTLQQRLEAKPKAEPDEGSSRKAKGNDLEVLSNKDFAEYLIEKVGEVYRPYMERIDALESNRSVDRADSEIQRIVKTQPEFWKFQDELKDVIKTHPTLSVEEAFTLAQKRNPEKTAEVAKEKGESAAKAKAAEAAVEKAKFGGLLPTSGKAAKSEDLDMDEAAEAAWKDLGVAEHLHAVSGSN